MSVGRWFGWEKREERGGNEKKRGGREGEGWEKRRIEKRLES